MTTTTPHSSKPWYREPWPWFLISLPATAVIAGLLTVWIAASNRDGLVVGDYYKAGLAINQTLARDDAARRLGLKAVLRSQDGGLSLALAGHLQAYPDQLTFTLAHPTRPGMDQTIDLRHAGGGAYRASLPALPHGKWHAQLTDNAGVWRLSGVLHTPFSEPATLAAAAEPTVQSQGD
jgi:hypothetical protein